MRPHSKGIQAETEKPVLPLHYSRGVRLTATDVGITAGILGLTSMVGLWFWRLGFNEANIITVYILGVLFTSISTNGRVYGGIASFLSVVIFNYLFAEPRFTLWAYNTGYLITFAVMFIASFITSTLTMRVREQAHQTAQKAYSLQVLLETSQMLQRAKNGGEIIDQAAHQLTKLLGRSVCVYPVCDHGLGDPVYFGTNSDATIPDGVVAESELAMASWVYANQHHAGATTDVYPDAQCLYLAVKGQNAVFAVVGVLTDGSPIDDFEKNLLVAMLGECALAMEKEQINETKNRIAIQAQREELRANLLRAISHDLRTPLTSISGNAGILMNNILSEAKKQRLYTDIYDDAIWLINLVENLLSVTRIDNGTMDLHVEPELLDEVMQDALAHINREGSSREIKVSLDDDMLMARMDSRLIVQVIINIVNNAIRFTSSGAGIDIRAQRVDNKMVLIEIADDGDGIPDSSKERVFEMFYSTANKNGDRRRGLGLGLSLCRSIINAHGGTIYVKDNVPHGAVFCFTLPAEDVHLND